MIGAISLVSLPVEQYPDIAPPTVMVQATYTGADADAVMNSVIMPLEESINSVENMMYISSTATNSGTATINVYFKQGTDPDMAAVNVQNRVSMAQGLLPAEVTQIGVQTIKRQNSFLQINSLKSPDGRYDETFIANYLDINVIPEIKRIPGVGEVVELGDTYSMRIWLNPERMAQYGLQPSDVTAVLNEQNLEAPTGSLGENSDNVFRNIGHRYHLGYPRGLFLPARFQEHADSVNLHHCFAGRNLCLFGCCRIQYQHSDTVCLSACHRYCGGRCGDCGRSGTDQVRHRI